MSCRTEVSRVSPAFSTEMRKKQSSVVVELIYGLVSWFVCQTSHVHWFCITSDGGVEMGSASGCLVLAARLRGLHSSGRRGAGNPPCCEIKYKAECMQWVFQLFMGNFFFLIATAIVNS